ncbi:MAG: glutamate synthase-related protein, partial [Candidatus Hydrogenedentes bacterium]|nr:glutamate synthase-related protein [Candidatus Hydrogenedentota bacterium]
YICTGVDIGRKLHHLTFAQGQLAVVPPGLMEIPFPVIFDLVPAHFQRGVVLRSIAKAAATLDTLFVANGSNVAAGISLDEGYAVPLYEAGDAGEVRTAAPMIMTPYSENVLDFQAHIKSESPNRLVAIRLEATPDAARQVCELTRDGAEVVHLVFDPHGREHASAASSPRHMRDVLREVHRALVKDGTRDLVTLIASGGIAQAEHVAKAIICGADLVAIDLPLLVALECRLCGECTRSEECPAHLEDADEGYAVQRIVNLMGAWQNQLLELLGAMGIREMRRLRGETGRAMFFEDLEATHFGRLFGTRKLGIKN